MTTLSIDSMIIKHQFTYHYGGDAASLNREMPQLFHSSPPEMVKCGGNLLLRTDEIWN